MDVLETMVKGSRNVTTSLVVNELRNLGLTDTTSAHGWMEVVHLDELDEFDALVRWADRIGARSGHNRGEVTVFAWAEAHGATPIIDDIKARKVATGYGLASHGSLWVFAETVNRGVESEKSLCGLLDVLINVGGARYPFSGGKDFGAWARSERLLP